jgi:hypothetical protein
MSSEETFEQSGGDNSTNIQGANVVVNYGITRGEAKEIALNVFRSNFIELSEAASRIAKERAEELVENYISTLQIRAPQSLANIVDPGNQFALFTAQKEYARTGDKNLSPIYVNLLAERITNLERDLMQISIDEGLALISKLTISQIDILTIVFLMKYGYETINIDEDFTFENDILPFCLKEDISQTMIDHLIYSGCATAISNAVGFENLLLTKLRPICKILMGKSFARKEIGEIMKIEVLKKYLLYDKRGNPSLILNKEDSRSVFMNFNIPTAHQKFCNWAFKICCEFTYPEVRGLIGEQSRVIQNLVEFWNESDLKYLELTGVGKVIANANYTRRTSKTIKLRLN